MLFLSIFWLSFSSCLKEVTTLSCGIDSSTSSHVYEGVSRLETYPWLGVLYYPYNRHKFTTAVVLVTRQFVLAAATEIDKLPKDDFRGNARVVIGHNCSGPYINVRDYIYHPDYSKGTYSTLAIIQLEIDHVTVELRPICPPPSHFKGQEFYAMVLSSSCKRSKVSIHKMKYVSQEQCKSFYRRSNLDVDTLWPSHTACARSTSGGHCVWRSGAILVVKAGKRWRLLGFGVYGPGCQAPARFLDYGMYHEWVRRSVARVGRPAITNLADNYVVMRRSNSRIQRFGPCDLEEMKKELYTEEIDIKSTNPFAIMRYNLTIVADMEYSCVEVKAEFKENKGSYKKPKLRIRRWCAGGTGICFGFGHMEMQFYVEISSSEAVNLRVTAYGTEAKYINPANVYKYLNKLKENPIVLNYNETKDIVKNLKSNSEYPAFGKGCIASTYLCFFLNRAKAKRGKKEKCCMG